MMTCGRPSLSHEWVEQVSGEMEEGRGGGGTRYCYQIAVKWWFTVTLPLHNPYSSILNLSWTIAVRIAILQYCNFPWRCSNKVLVVSSLLLRLVLPRFSHTPNKHGASRLVYVSTFQPYRTRASSQDYTSFCCTIFTSSMCTLEVPNSHLTEASVLKATPSQITFMSITQ